MKILFIGDYSGFHATLAGCLRSLGHECVVVSDGSQYMDVERDIDLTRKPGRLNSFRYLFNVADVVSKLKGFDVVQFINPCFLQLKPAKLKYFFKKLKKHNGLMGLTLAGTDSLFAKELLTTELLRYSEYKINGVLTPYGKSLQGNNGWMNERLHEHCRYIYDNIDLAVSALYEYHLLAGEYLNGKPLHYGGIPINVNSLPFREFSSRKDGKINILVAIKNELANYKGTDTLLAAALEVERRYPDKCNVMIAQNLKLKDYLAMVEEADVVLDQIYSYTPATNALQSLAMGKIVISGAEPEYYDFIGEGELNPIFNVQPDEADIVSVLEKIVNLPENELKLISRQGRQFVEKHNSADVVASNFLKAWNLSMK